VRMTHQRRLLIQIIQSAESIWMPLLSGSVPGRRSTLNKVTVYRTLAMLRNTAWWTNLTDAFEVEALLRGEGGSGSYSLGCSSVVESKNLKVRFLRSLRADERERRFSIKVSGWKPVVTAISVERVMSSLGREARLHFFAGLSVSTHEAQTGRSRPTLVNREICEAR